jgi:hypothetical protein
MEVDPQFDTNMSSVNRVSNKLLYLNSFWNTLYRKYNNSRL